MSKPTKSKNGKVPKITEEEYTAYLASLREMSEDRDLHAPEASEKKSK